MSEATTEVEIKAARELERRVRAHAVTESDDKGGVPWMKILPIDSARLVLLLDQGKPAPFVPPADQVAEAERLLAYADPLDLTFAKFLWETHRAFLGGVSSAGGVKLPDWEECKPIPKAAHLSMAIGARAYLTTEPEVVRELAKLQSVSKAST